MTDEAKRVRIGLQKVLDSHGYGFQYSVLNRCMLQCEAKKSAWVFDVAEFPVGVNQRETKIDFVLRHPRTNAYLIAECKRANPAFASWAFVGAPYRWRDQTSAQPIRVERVRRFKDEVRAESVVIDRAPDAYQIGLELRTNESGEAEARGRGAIDDAVGQVLKGVGGFVEFLSTRPNIIASEKPSIVIPVIVTTATIWTSNAQLTEADLSTGQVNFSAHAVREAPWILYQHPVSIAFSHNVPGHRIDAPLSSVLEVDITRTIAIVNHSGIDSFLEWSSAIE